MPNPKLQQTAARNVRSVHDVWPGRLLLSWVVRCLATDWPFQSTAIHATSTTTVTSCIPAATILHLMGFDHEKLVFRHGGRDMRLTDVAGSVIRPILA